MSSPRARARVVLVATVLLTFVVSHVVRGRLARPSSAPVSGMPGTVVSLAPSLTEIVFALGAGERLVGVTRYCRYPPEALTKREVGGYFDPNFETILGLNPDLVLLLKEHDDVRSRLESTGRRVLAVDHTTIDGIIASIEEVGSALGVAERGEDIARDLRRRTAAIRRAAEGRERPRVLISVDRPVGQGAPTRLYVCGRNEFFDPMIEWAGGKNAYTGPDIPYPAITPEGLMRMDPEVVIDLIPPGGGKEALLAARGDWNAMPSLSAVRNGRVHVWADDYVMIPGPRFIQALEKLAQTLDPKRDG